MEKEIKINVPEGFEIDKENSTFECVKFRPISKQKFEYVDLGLPSGTLWATMNVGANSSFDSGHYLTFEKACKYELPKRWQFEELIEECDWEWQKRLEGYLITGSNKHTIFLPAAGYLQKVLLYDRGSSGCYWSCSQPMNYPNLVYNLQFSPFDIHTSSTSCCEGQNVRPIINTKSIKTLN